MQRKHWGWDEHTDLAATVGYGGELLLDSCSLVAGFHFQKATKFKIAHGGTTAHVSDPFKESQHRSKGPACATKNAEEGWGGAW